MGERSSVIYQYVVLCAVIMMNMYILVKTGQLDQTLTGALIGVMVGVGINKK